MRIFETNFAMDFMEVAYFIQISEDDYLCIYENSPEDELDKPYTIGEIEEFICSDGLDEVIEEKHEMVLKKSPLYNTFFFNEFIKNLK